MKTEIQELISHMKIILNNLDSKSISELKNNIEDIKELKEFSKNYSCDIQEIIYDINK